MCSLFLALDAWEGTQAFVAANRDERLDRPSLPPRLFPDRQPLVWAPQDQVKGGSWLGLNARGLFAGLTNRFGTPPDPDRRSRGFIVFEALRAGDLDGAAQVIRGLEVAETNPFHLLLVQGRRALVLWSDGHRLHEEALAPGLHVLCERSYGAAACARPAWLQEQLTTEPADPAAWRRILGHHHPDDPFDGPCVHVPAWNYGTRSSTLLRLGAAPAAWHAEGSPCENDYTDYSRQVQSLLTSEKERP